MKHVLIMAVAGWAVCLALTAAVCLFNVRGTVGMALHLLQKVKKRRAA